MSEYGTTFFLFAAAAALLASAGVAVSAEPGAQPAEPADEVMRPTQFGLRATPELARQVTGMIVEHEGWVRDLGLDPQQKDRLAEVMARRVMATAHTDGRQWRDLIEYLMEGEARESRRRFDSQTGAELGRRFLALSDKMRGFADGVVSDSREFLRPEQVDAMDKWVNRMRADIDSAEAQMKRWATGEVDEHGRPFENPRPQSQQAESTEQKAARQRKRRLNSAREGVEHQLRELSPDAWEDFLVRSASFFSFSDAQRTEANRIKEKYAKQVQAVMTPEWRLRFRVNCIRESLVEQSDLREPFAPWLNRLKKEKTDLTRPVENLTNAFRDEVIGLATAEQRSAALAKVSEAAGRHGLSSKEMPPIPRLLG